MRKELKAHLADELKAYQDKNYHLAYVLHALRGKITTWLSDQKLDPNTFTWDEQTMLAMDAMCDAQMRVN